MHGTSQRSIYWPSMSAQITEMCEQCSTCAEYRTKQQKEPTIVTQVPDYPWQKVSSDLFSFDGESYFLVGDYFSKFVEYTKLSHTQRLFVVCGIGLTSSQLFNELFPDCTRSCFLQVVLRHRGGDCIYFCLWD